MQSQHVFWDIQVNKTHIRVNRVKRKTKKHRTLFQVQDENQSIIPRQLSFFLLKVFHEIRKSDFNEHSFWNYLITFQLECGFCFDIAGRVQRSDESFDIKWVLIEQTAWMLRKQRVMNTKNCFNIVMKNRIFFWWLNELNDYYLCWFYK